MKTYTQAVVIGGLLTAVLAVPAVASSDERGECHRGGHFSMMGHHRDGEDHFVKHLTRRLDLTPEQQTAIQETLKKSEAERRAARDQLQANREALRKLTDAGQADPQALQKLAQEQGKLMAEQIVRRAQVHAEIQKLLTAEQREQLKQMRDRHGRHFRG
jgi:Spy/CpxP family protein refolding chaperone